MSMETSVRRLEVKVQVVSTVVTTLAFALDDAGDWVAIRL